MGKRVATSSGNPTAACFPRVSTLTEISLIHFVELRQMAFSVGSQTFSQFQRQPAANVSKSGGAAAARRNLGGEPEFFSVMETIAVHIFSQEKKVSFV